MKFLDFSKLAIYGIFLNYYCYYVLKGSFIPHGTVLFLLISLGFTLLEIISVDRGLIYVGSEIRCWVVYGVLAFITTYFFSTHSNAVISDIIKYFQRLALIMMIAYICEKEHSIKFALRLLAISAAGCSFAVFRTLGSIEAKLDITSGAAVSVNDVGSLMAFGVIAVLFAYGNRYRSSSVLVFIRFACIIAFSTVIFLAGSRKSIVAIAIFFILFFISCSNDYFHNMSAVKMIIILLLFVVAFYFVYHFLWQYVESTNLYVRTLGRGAERTTQSDLGRIELYKKAFRDFISHPVIGIGYNNFMKYHGIYTHSTYAEPFACSGIIGLVYLYPYFKMLTSQFSYIKLMPYDSYDRTWQKIILCFMIAFYFVGAGIPYIYKDIPCILLGMFVASQSITRDRLYYDEE